MRAFSNVLKLKTFGAYTSLLFALAPGNVAFIVARNSRFAIRACVAEVGKNGPHCRRTAEHSVQMCVVGLHRIASQPAPNLAGCRVFIRLKTGSVRYQGAAPFQILNGINS